MENEKPRKPWLQVENALEAARDDAFDKFDNGEIPKVPSYQDILNTVAQKFDTTAKEIRTKYKDEYMNWRNS